MVFSCTAWCIFAISCLVLICGRLSDKQPSPLFGIYARKSGFYWAKVLFMYLMLKIQKLKRFRALNKAEYFQSVDKPQKLSSHEKAIDAVYFNGANKYGDHFVLGTARRKNRLIDGLLYVKINDSKLGVLEIPKLPDTSLFNNGNEDNFEAEGIKVEVVEPTKKWRILYAGKMKKFVGDDEVDDKNDDFKIKSGEIQQKFDVKIEGIWTADTPYFNYEIHMDDWDMAKAFAYEKWSRAYFQNLKDNHTIHYEQFGSLQAKITINQKEYSINFETVRDHSIATKREWAQFHRYGMQFFSAENGDRFSMGSICMPISFSRLNVGFMYCAQDNKIYPLRDLDFNLYNHGELGHPPKDFAFTFKAGPREYVVQVNVTDSPYFYISKNWEAKIWERLCTFEINGVKGYGASEWTYRNVPGRAIVNKQLVSYY